jgi:hypothetical protein
MTQSIYSGDRGLDRHHLIFISSFHATKIHILSFPTFGLTCWFLDFVDLRNCMDPHGQVVSQLLTNFPMLLKSAQLFLMNSIWKS